MLVEVNAVAHAAAHADPIVATFASGLGNEAAAVSEGAGGIDVDGVGGAGFQGVVGLGGHREGGGGGAEERDGAEEGAGDEHDCGWRWCCWVAMLGKSVSIYGPLLSMRGGCSYVRKML